MRVQLLLSLAAEQPRHLCWHYGHAHGEAGAADGARNEGTNGGVDGLAGSEAEGLPLGVLNRAAAGGKEPLFEVL
eukprot:6813617-Lingulodinium_polyedra.AAC.1